MSKSKLWEEFIVEVTSPLTGNRFKCCGLCGNTGWLHKSGLTTPGGCDVPTSEGFCICPNGRSMKRKGDKGELR